MNFSLTYVYSIVAGKHFHRTKINAARLNFDNLAIFSYVVKCTHLIRLVLTPVEDGMSKADLLTAAVSFPASALPLPRLPGLPSQLRRL